MTDTVDTPEAIRKLSDETNEWFMSYEVDGATVEMVKDALTRYAELLEQVAAHEKVCAGKWVKVEERGPVGPEPMNYRVIVETALSAVYEDTVQFHSGEWHFAMEQWEPGLVVTHWLDARLPGEER